MSESHTEGKVEAQFCSVRTRSCPCGNKYRAPCDATAAAWEAASLGSSKYAQKYKTEARSRSHAAHHIACVASVIGQITKNPDIQSIVHQTKWCINAKPNMMAVPMWAHTIQWYVNMTTGVMDPDPSEPPFSGLAQHDYDHARYNDEVNETLKQVSEVVIKAAAKHEDPCGTLVRKLNAAISTHKGNISGRSTHAAWKDGMDNPNGDWYKAFSMSQDPSVRAFPVGKNTMATKIAAVREAFRRLKQLR